LAEQEPENEQKAPKGDYQLPNDPTHRSWVKLSGEGDVQNREHEERNAQPNS
jgi:hypothetical protein